MTYLYHLFQKGVVRLVLGSKARRKYVQILTGSTKQQHKQVEAKSPVAETDFFTEVTPHTVTRHYTTPTLDTCVKAKSTTVYFHKTDSPNEGSGAARTQRYTKPTIQPICKPTIQPICITPQSNSTVLQSVEVATQNKTLEFFQQIIRRKSKHDCRLDTDHRSGVDTKAQNDSASNTHGNASHTHDAASNAHGNASHTHDSASNAHGNASDTHDSASHTHDAAFNTKSTRQSLQCASCPYSTTRKSSLVRHQQQHTGLNFKWQCDTCDSFYASKSLLLQHYSLVHGVSLDSNQYINTKSTRQSLQCASCPYSTTRKSNLVRHQQRHTGLKYQCDTCDSLYASKSLLLQHYTMVHGAPLDSNQYIKPTQHVICIQPETNETVLPNTGTVLPNTETVLPNTETVTSRPTPLFARQTAHRQCEEDFGGSERSKVDTSSQNVSKPAIHIKYIKSGTQQNVFQINNRSTKKPTCTLRRETDSESVAIVTKPAFPNAESGRRVIVKRVGPFDLKSILEGSNNPLSSAMRKRGRPTQLPVVCESLTALTTDPLVMSSECYRKYSQQIHSGMREKLGHHPTSQTGSVHSVDSSSSTGSVHSVDSSSSIQCAIEEAASKSKNLELIFAEPLASALMRETYEASDTHSCGVIVLD